MIIHIAKYLRDSGVWSRKNLADDSGWGGSRVEDLSCESMDCPKLWEFSKIAGQIEHVRKYGVEHGWSHFERCDLVGQVFLLIGPASWSPITSTQSLMDLWRGHQSHILIEKRGSIDILQGSGVWRTENKSVVIVVVRRGMTKTQLEQSLGYWLQRNGEWAGTLIITMNIVVSQ